MKKFASLSHKKLPKYKKTLVTTTNVLAVTAGLLMLPSATQADVLAKNVGDLEIYQAADGSKINLMMMLDTSGSMGISSLVLPTNNSYGSPGDVTSSLCSKVGVVETGSDKAMNEWQYNAIDNRPGSATKDKKSFIKTVTVNGQAIPYYLRGCGTPNINSAGVLIETGQGKFDRLSRLKDALIQLLAGTSISDSVSVGLGNFSSKTPILVGNTTNKLVDGHSGSILVPVAPLTQSQRLKLIQAIAAYKSVDTTTNEDGTPNGNLKLSSTTYPDISKSSSGTPSAHAYAEAGAYMMGTTTGVDPLPPTRTSILYDGYSVMQKLDDATQQVYYVCVGLGSERPEALGSTVFACDNEWNKKEADWYDTTNKRMGSTIKIYKPNVTGGWTPVTPTELYNTAGVGAINSLWETHSKLPVGWRYGGWMKVANEPMDIEPIGSKVWGNKGANNLVSYRSSPFSLKTATPSTTITTNPVDNNYGGFAYSADDTKSGDNYIRGATATNSVTARCDANGIYFLTDGAPNSTKDSMAQTIVNKSLNDDARYTIAAKPTAGLSSPTLTAGVFTGETGGWEWIGEYAKRLNDKEKNPAGIKISTAIAGFGSSFDGLTKRPDGTYDCDTAGASPDAKNACKWGQKGQGYGEGGFFYTQSSSDIANSILTYIASLNNTIPTAPSGTITIPKDPYRAIGELPYAFLPTLESQLSGENNTNNIWPGNVKKYSLKDGTLYGQDNNALFSNVNGDLNSATRDLWQDSNYTVTNSTTGINETKNDAVKAGGIYQNLVAPNTTNSTATRNIWVEDITAANATTTTLRQISVNEAGVSSGFDALLDLGIKAYSRANQIKLLKFLGYESATNNNVTKSLDEWANTTNAGVAIKDLVLVKPTNPIKVLGASVHSKPVAVSYGATLENGRVKDAARDDYVLFGSMDGALHLADADDYSNNGNSKDGGTEKLAVIPKVMMSQVDALVPNSKYIASTTRPASVPYFGIDGGWVVNTNYTYNYAANKVTANKVYAYGGMRLGGKGLLGFDLTTSTNPTVAFSGLNKALIDSDTAGFERIGNIWNPPTVIKVKTSDSDTIGTEALVFGGGYDKCYENQNFQIGVTATTKNGIDSTCAAKPQAEGNAVYIINATTGALMWSATFDATATGDFNGKAYMKHSIVGGVTALDRNNDGFMDQLYFDDLGGQVFRADFKNGTVATDKGRVVRLLKDEAEATSMARRFYERPNVSFHRNTADNKLIAVINVISGDRSSPLSKIRGGTTAADVANNADRLYGIIDTDVTLADTTFYATTHVPTIKDLVVNTTTPASSNFAKLGTLDATNTKATLTTSLQNYSKHGWYYPLTKFDGYDNVKYSKGLGRSEIIAAQLYTSVYNPDMNYSAADGCTAKITGGSEREMYCLPWGICSDDSSTNGTGGYERAGQGIQEINFGPQSATQLNQRLMIGTMTLTSAVVSANRRGWGDDPNKILSTTVGGIGLKKDSQDQGSSSSLISKINGNGNMPRDIFLERYILTPKRWYEQN